MAVKPIPEGYHTVTPYLISQDAEQLLTFLKKAFGATETMHVLCHLRVGGGDSRMPVSETVRVG